MNRPVPPTSPAQVTPLVLVLCAALLLAAPTPQAHAQGPSGTADDPPVVGLDDEVPTRRLAGPGRYATAVAVSQDSVDPGVDVAYVATGQDFADALAVGPVAAAAGAPVLLTPPAGLPTAVADELDRLDPGRIVVVGGSATVPDALLGELAAHTDGEVERVSGPDRHATAAAVSAEAFPDGAERVFLATGTAFADALTGGVAAGRADAPILLATRDRLPSSTEDELRRLGPDEIVVLGGTKALGQQVAAQAAAATDATVVRLAGQDRFATAAAIAESTFPDVAGTAYLATGTAFPDALTGVPAAVGADAPLLLSRTGCLPAATQAELSRLAPAAVVLLGGPDALTEEVHEPCGDPSDLPPPTFAIDPDVTTDAPQPPPFADGRERPVAALTDEHGNTTGFVADEVVVAGDEDAMEELLDRTGGEVLASVDTSGVGGETPGVHLVRVDAEEVSGEAVADDVRTIDPYSRGAHRVSSQEGLDTLGLAASETAAGGTVGLNVFAETTDLADEEVVEALSALGPPSAPTYSPNPFDWDTHRSGSVPSIGIGQAWRSVVLSGDADGERIPIGIIDAGCATSPDLPSTTGADNENEESYHCTAVATAAAGLVDNGIGAAGPAGPVGRIIMFPDAFDGVFAFTMAELIIDAAMSDAEIVNMSVRGRAPAGIGWTVDPVANMILDSHELFGVLHFASAGNDGIHVDDEDCFVACWESARIWPCEMDKVVCVGGLRHNSLRHDAASNWGNLDVDLWAPYCMWTGPTPDDGPNTPAWRCGTSFSSPMVAGIAALVQAADRDLDNDGLWEVLRDTSVLGRDRAGNVVQADQAVASRYDGNSPAHLSIVQPANGARVDRGRRVDVQADADDPGDDPPHVDWLLDGEEIIIGRASSDFSTAGLSFGEHVLEARIEDGDFTIVDEVTIRVRNQAPRVDIVNPSDGDEVALSETIVLRADTFDPDGPIQRIDWLSGGAALASGSPATMTGSDLGVGMHTLEVRASDGRLTATDTVNITVVEDPPDLPPTPTILEPEDGSTIPDGEPVTLSGIATDPEDGDTFDPEDVVWTTTWDADGDGEDEVEILGTGFELEEIVQPERTCDRTGLIEHVLTLSVTDADGNTGTDSIVVDSTLIC